jgi:AcrR family transcriptional regulator
VASKHRPARAVEAAVETSPRRRLSRSAREEVIVAAAAALFAEVGFAAPTRELARRLGVTQALLYRYFPSKQHLIERVFEHAFGRLQAGAADPALKERSQPLEARLIGFYQAYLARVSFTSIRLFVRAGLEGGDLARRFSAPLTTRLLVPMIEELRHAAGLPGCDVRPLMRGERELAMALHGGVVFLGIRKHIYGMPMPEDLSDLVALQVRAYLPGALAELRRLHGAAGEPSLTVRQLDHRERRSGPSR